MPVVAVIGCGAWATTVAQLIAENGHSVTLLCHRNEYVETIERDRENTLALPGFKVSDLITPTIDPEKIASAAYWVICVPSKFLSGLTQLQPSYSGQSIISLIKGLPDVAEWGLASDYIKQAMGCPTISVLSGPNLASEVAQHLPGATVVAAPTEALNTQWQSLLHRPYFRLYRSVDIRGVELGGLLKNVYAIAGGIVDGLGLGENAKAALMTRALSEMIRIGTEFGAEKTTFYGLSGLGDLMATSYSQSSRNWQLGYTLATETPESRIDRGVAEGARTVRLLSPQLNPNADYPIFNAIHSVIAKNANIADVMATLMQRELKSE
ncbi:NAD(P)H-dependent glycerol-3-phosphate dehydrogenase [bacterium]|nr:NAD(P)H-dependent glycerol-3-phosphate dehydrogenase [bacterium]